MNSELFRRYLRQNKLTAAEVSRRTGIGEGLLSMILAGRSPITLRTACLLADGMEEHYSKFYSIKRSEVKK